MENRQLVAERIKLEAKRHGISVKHLLEECELGVNTVGKLAKGTDITSQNLAKIADYLEVSVDYLLGRDESYDNRPEFPPKPPNPPQPPPRTKSRRIHAQSPPKPKPPPPLPYPPYIGCTGITMLLSSVSAIRTPFSLRL